MDRMNKVFCIIVLALLNTACTTNNGIDSNTSNSSTNVVQSVFDSEANLPYLEPYHAWQGTPYKFGGNNKRGVDCSAFVQAVFLEAQNESLPRTTAEQSKLGFEVSLSDARSGDLVFFKTSRKVRHVGVYLGEYKFMHASTSKGVIISRLNNPYWASVFWQVRRVN